MTKNTLTDIELFVQQAVGEMDLGGHLVLAVNAPVILLDLIKPILLKDNKTFAAIYWDQPEGRRFVLISNEGCVDVSEVAKLYRGGGKSDLAAFVTPPQKDLGGEFIPLALEFPPDDLEVIGLFIDDEDKQFVRNVHHKMNGKFDDSLYSKPPVAWAYMPELPGGLDTGEILKH